jgi:hypothetical protein
MGSVGQEFQEDTYVLMLLVRGGVVCLFVAVCLPSTPNARRISITTVQEDASNK